MWARKNAIRTPLPPTRAPIHEPFQQQRSQLAHPRCDPQRPAREVRYEEPAAAGTATWDADPEPAETLDLADLNLDPALLEDATQEEVQAESEDPSSPLGRFMRFLTRP